MVIAVDCRALLESVPGGITGAAHALLASLARVTEPNELRAVFATRRRVVQSLRVPTYTIRRSNRALLLRHALGSATPYDVMVERSLGFRPDVVFAPTIQPIATAATPLVLVVHDCSFLRFPHWLAGRDRWWHSLVRPRRVIASAQAIICPSNATQLELEHFFPHLTAHITVIPWGAPVASNKGVVPRMKDGAPYVLAIGTRHRRKNPVLIERLRRFLCTLNPPHSLVEIDPSRAVTEEEKWGRIANARALIYPSFYEGFGVPPVEAMALSVPVVASLSSALVETIGDGGLLVQPHAPEQWQHALASILGNAELRKRLIDRGSARVRQLSWDQSARQVLTVLRGVVSELRT